MSSHGSDFNFDFDFAFTEEQMATGELAKMVAEAGDWLVDWADNVGTDLAHGMAESPGWNVFALENGRRRQQPLELSASADGPLLVTGGVRILDAEGALLYEGERAALCRCGGSANKPFCDGTHKNNGFRGRNSRIAFTHTEVDEPYEGRGFGGVLAEAALNMAGEEGLEVIPLCPFSARYIDENPSYERLVAADHRGR